MANALSELDDPKFSNLLEGLHRRSVEQQKLMDNFFRDLSRNTKREDRPAEVKKFLSDKMVALEPEKAEFCYLLCRAIKARRVIEVGTSYGVSTLYLAAAVRENARDTGEKGLVIGTENELVKAQGARANFAEAGLSEFIELREGDIRQTLCHVDAPADFVLIDIWVEMARAAIEVVAPHLRPGSVVICDNTKEFRESYQRYFDFVNDPSNRLRTMTLPFSGGLEMTVRL